MAIKKEIDPTVPRKRRGSKNRPVEEVVERTKSKRIKPPPPPPPPEDDEDDEEEDEDNITDDGILAGIDPESRTQNRIVQNVLKRREEGGRVPWHGQDNIKYNCASEKCLSLFGAESEVEIVRERPSAHHITLSPLAKFPKWMDVYSFLKETQWDGSAQKYKIMVYSTGRSVAAVCYLTLDEDERRKLEWRKHWEHVRAGQAPAPAQEHVPSWQQQQVPQQQPQAQQPVQPAPQPQQQQSQVQPQSFQQPQPQPPSPFPQPQQPYNQPLPWQPQGPAWQPQAPQQLQQPPWPGGWPQQPPSPFQQPPPFQQQFVQEEEDDEEEDEDDDVEEQAFQPPQRWQREDPKVALLERNIHALTKQITKLQRSNQKEMAGANSQVAYQQQWQVWQMLTGMNQSLQAMSTQLEEAKKQAAQPPPPPPPPPPIQQPQSQMMTVEEIMKIVDERMRQPQQQQSPMGMQMPMGMGMQMPMMPPAPPPPPEPTDSLGEIKRTVKQVADLRKMFEDLQPQQPQPPAWMQQMPPPPQAMVQSEAKAEDGSPLKVFEMGPFRYVTDKEGKAVDFFTMMMLNADNVKSWVEPGLKAFGELREQVKDARKKNEMQDTLRMFEHMNNQVMHNQQLQAQQIEQLNQRLAPSQSTIDALQAGNVEVLSSSPVIRKREPQPGPVAKPIVLSGQRKSLLDGLANAQRALQSKK